tara:strand:- start:20 stop:376 length:357 start_codon:yes stop_codon:yes gene_type:complete
MSTITVTNIKATGETASRPVSGVAGAWVTKNAAGTTIEDSVNVSTLTDVGTGIATYTFTNNFSNNTYQYATGTRSDGVRIYTSPTGNITTSSLQIRSYNLSEALSDRESGTAVHGDLA